MGLETGICSVAENPNKLGKCLINAAELFAELSQNTDFLNEGKTN
jgi:hypothetical protein